MNVLVTGARGFVGSHLVALAARERPSWTLRPFLGSILSLTDLRAAFQKRVDIVIHLAAKVGAIASLRQASHYARTNLEGTANLLASAADHGVEAFLQMSTVDVYGAAHKPTEDAPIRPTSPYAISKAAADFLALESQLRTFVVRAPSIYGPWDSPNKMIPFFIGRVRAGLPIELYGDGLQERDWIHVEDVARAILLVIEKGIPREAYNLGSPRTYSNLDVTRRVLEAMERPHHPIVHVPDMPGHGKLYAADYGRIRAMGYEPKLILEDGLPDVVRWYMKNRPAPAAAGGAAGA